MIENIQRNIFNIFLVLITAYSTHFFTIRGFEKQFELNVGQQIENDREESYIKLMGLKSALYAVSFNIVSIYTSGKYYQGMYDRYGSRDNFLRVVELEKELRSEYKNYSDIIREIYETIAKIKINFELDSEVEKSIIEVIKIDNVFYNIRDPKIGSDRTDLIKWEKDELKKADEVIREHITSKIDKLIEEIKKGVKK